MKTFIRLDNANCSDCLNTVSAELTDRPLVNSVELSATSGCLEVDHDNDDPQALLDVLNSSLHGFVLADNGEVVYVQSGAKLSPTCIHNCS